MIVDIATHELMIADIATGVQSLNEIRHQWGEAAVGNQNMMTIVTQSGQFAVVKNRYRKSSYTPDTEDSLSIFVNHTDSSGKGGKGGKGKGGWGKGGKGKGG